MSPQLSHVARWVPFLLLIMSFLIGWAFLGLIVSGQDMVASLYPSGILAAGRIIILRWAPQHGSRAAMAWVVFNLSLTFIGRLFNPFLSIYSFSGYIDIEYLLESRHAVPAGISTAMVTAAGQAGSLHGMSAVIWSYPLLAAVNIGIMLVMLATRRDRDRQVRAKEAAMRQLAETKAVNMELHQYLVEQARCMGIEQERGRLSREIHDTVAQGLIGVIRQLEAVPAHLDATIQVRLDRAESAARDCLVEARRAVRALGPRELEQAPLPEALHRIIASWARLHRIFAEFDADEAPAPSRHDAVLIRVAQEALANIARHSQAQAVHVRLVAGGTGPELTVRDDGRGFTPDIGVGSGLRGMRQRLEEAGGSLRIESAPGAGCTVIAEVPA